MAKQATSLQPVNLSFSQPAYVFVFFDAEIGPARVLVPDGATVDYCAVYLDVVKRYLLGVWIDDNFVGWHCGERSGDVIDFVRESDAVRLADVRNAAWAARCSVESEVV